MLKKLVRRTKLTAIIAFCIAGLQSTQAQITPQQVMTQIYKAYDSLSYISFDVKYVYGTDTLYGDFKKEVMPGTYTMAGKKAKYSIGDIDFMQNDSFFIAVYNKDKFIIVADPKTNNTGSQLPMRELMDSMIQTYGEHYTITTDTGSGIIQFIKADTLAQFNTFTVNYNKANYYLNSIEYDFQTMEPLNNNDATDTSATPQTMPQITYVRQKKFRIEFSNYRIDNFSDSLYSENNYIWFEDGECKPVDKYKDFKVYYSKSSN